MGDDAFQRLKGHKHDEESWTDFGHRVADILDQHNDDTEHTSNTAVVENIGELARATADEVENRMTRR